MFIKALGSPPRAKHAAVPRSREILAFQGHRCFFPRTDRPGTKGHWGAAFRSSLWPCAVLNTQSQAQGDAGRPRSQ